MKKVEQNVHGKPIRRFECAEPSHSRRPAQRMCTRATVCACDEEAKVRGNHDSSSNHGTMLLHLLPHFFKDTLA
jgi:hypothetical protein